MSIANFAHYQSLSLSSAWSSGVTGAKAATLSFLVGGTEDAFKLTEPILQHMGKRIIHCGASGSGLASKICNNLVLGVEQIVTAEAMLLGQRLGVKPGVLADVINSSTGACWSCSVNNPVPSALPDKSPPCERDYDGGFATALMLKVRWRVSRALFPAWLLLNVFAAAGHGSRIRERQPDEYATATRRSGGANL